jgi:hypothetical protein
MLVVANNIAEILKDHRKVVGFYGSPPRTLLYDAATRWSAPLVDLDVDYGAPRTSLISKAYCHIIRNCVDNAMALRGQLACLVAATGKEKCDAGRFAAFLIREQLGIEVLFTENEALPPPVPARLSEARGSVKQRAIRIMRSIVDPFEPEEIDRADADRCEPTHGFWGTPPHPIELLDLFPDTTHLFGWTRCVEQGRPADLALEMSVPEGLPIVFFNQGFCPKAALAKHLADKYNGLQVDLHDAISAAVRAKVEAFIRLSGPGGGF